MSNLASTLWISCAESPLPSLELLPGGDVRVATRVFGPCDPIPIFLLGDVRIEKDAGEDRPLHLATRRGVTRLRHYDGAWYRESHRPGEDPLAWTVEPHSESSGASPAAPSSIAGRAVHASREATPGPNRGRPRTPVGRLLRFVDSCRATLLVLAISALTAAAAAQLGEGLARHLVFEPGQGPWYTIVSNGVYNPNPLEFGLWAVGILVFGAIVERNVGSWRLLLLLLAGAAGGAGGWWAFNSPGGLEIADREAGRIATWLVENRGLDDAMLFADAWRAVQPYQRWDVPIFGAAGSCGALIAYATLRRRIGSNDLGVRPFTFALGTAYIAFLIVHAWPVLVSARFPYPVFAGGLAAGIAFILPEKSLLYCWERLREFRAA